MLMTPVRKIYLASTSVDLRKSYQTLGLYVKSVLKVRIPINSIINSNFIRALIPILSGHKSKRINIDLNEFDGTSFFLFFLS